MIFNNKFKLKIGGVVAILASTLAFSPAANAINFTIGNSSANSNGTNVNLGQSFRNDPSASGSSINLETWTFSFFDVASQTTALSSVLTIYTGVGNGGSTVGTSSNTAFGGGNAVTWTFNGGLSIIDNVTYSAVLAPNLAIKTNSGLNPNPAYLDGAFTFGSTSFNSDDTVFEATFSNVTSVPFDFDPSFGVLLLGGAWAGNKALKKFKASRNLDVTQQKKD